MNAPLPVLGILVGGRSRRFPGGKLRAPLGGKSVLATCLHHLAAAAAQVYLLGQPPPGQRLPPEARATGLAHLFDPEPGGGPLAGFLALSRVAPAGFVVTAGDMPFLTAEALGRLWDAGVGYPAASFATAAGPLPLPAVVRPAAYPTLEALAARRPAPGPRRLLKEVGALAVTAADLGTSEAELLRWLRDIDTPEDLESVQTWAE